MSEFPQEILKTAQSVIDRMPDVAGLLNIGEFWEAVEKEVCTAILAERKRAEWQPIETAPKNTKVFAAYRNGLGNWRIVTACYHTQLPWSDEQDPDDDSEYAPEAWYEESETSETIYQTDCHPTHWIPLPSPPKTEDAA